MSNYHYRVNKNDELEVYTIDEYGENIIINDSKAIVGSLSYSVDLPFIVKMVGIEAHICNKKTKEEAIIVEPKKVLSRPELAEVSEKIKEAIAQEGCIFVKPQEKINRKPKKSTDIGAIAKSVGLIVIAGAITIGGLVYVLKNSNKEIDISEDEAIETMAKLEEELKEQDQSELNPMPDFIDVDELDSTALVPEVENVIKKTVKLDFEDNSNTIKAQTTKKDYFDLISKISPLYGIDPNLMLGLCTQEGVKHVPGINAGGAVGLCQIQAAVWIDDNLNETYYKFNQQTGEFELNKFGKITLEDLNDLEKNIHIGCRILQYCLRKCNYNLTAALQMYNMGYGSFFKLINNYAASCGKTTKEVLSNVNDLGWLDLRKLKGNDGYAERVNSWVDENNYNLVDVRNGEHINFVYTNENEENIHR